MATGTATIDFGAGSNEASVTVSDTGVTGTSKIEAWVMADSTSVDHTANDHKYFPLLASLTCSNPSAGVGFTIYARSIQKLHGAWTVQYVWAD